MTVAVDNPRQDNTAVRINQFCINTGKLGHRADIDDFIAVNQHRTIFNITVLLIHSDKIAVINQLFTLICFDITFIFVICPCQHGIAAR